MFTMNKQLILIKIRKLAIVVLSILLFVFKCNRLKKGAISHFFIIISLSWNLFQQKHLQVQTFAWSISNWDIYITKKLIGYICRSCVSLLESDWFSTGLCSSCLLSDWSFESLLFSEIGCSVSESSSESSSSLPSPSLFSWPTGTAPFLCGRTVKKASCQSPFSRNARMISKTVARGEMIG